MLLLISAYYSVDLGFKKYATLNVTGRVDKSSSLPSNSSTYFYPSFNLSSAVSDYLKMPESISFLKLRASYAISKSGGTSSTYSPDITGLPGNEYGYSYPSPYDGPSYQFSQNFTLSPTYNNVSSAVYSDQLVNPNIQTSKRIAYEFGVDIRFFADRVGLDITHYRYKNTGIVSQGISSASGYSTFLTNGNVYTNNGWEAVLNASILKNVNGLSWDVTMNWFTFKRMWVKNSNPDNYSYNGTRVDLVYNDAFVRTPKGQLVEDASSGLLLRYSDLGVSAKKVYGHYDPDWQWGFSNTFTYKNLSLHFQFDGIVGGVMEDYVRKKTLQGGRHIETVQGDFASARPDDGKVSSSYAGSYIGKGVSFPGEKITLDPISGKITNYADLVVSDNSRATSVQAYVTRMASIPDLDVIKKTFTKLREVSLMYKLPTYIIAPAKFIKGASLALVGRNLLYFFPKRYKDLDVDQYTQYSGSGLQTPSMRSYGVNLNVNF